jgi:hypothetical protein
MQANNNKQYAKLLGENVCAAAKKSNPQKKSARHPHRFVILVHFRVPCHRAYECHWPNTTLFKKKGGSLDLTTKPFDTAFFLVEAFILVVFVV